MAYPYQKLRDRDIRVLYLAPGGFSDPIRCGLITLSLDNSPRYEALSYAWGVIDSFNLITVDDCPMRIRVNLETALRHLRYEKRDRILWVDALCINQGDDEERTQQVAQMASVYSKAWSTVIYLGDQDPDADGAFDALEMFAQDRHLHEIRVWKAEDPSRLEWSKIIVIERILLFPWWLRIWVIQEVALARELSVALLCCDRTQLLT
jgi:Heterokaryon incompatibility protein (HET)